VITTNSNESPFWLQFVLFYKDMVISWVIKNIEFMSKMHIDYTGQLRNKAFHPSGAELVTDAPVDNHGKGESFSPTDLLCTALGTCMVTVMGIKAAKLGIPYEGIQADVLKYMSLDQPRRVIKIKITIQMPQHLSDSEHKSGYSPGNRI
jgi:uncharacterized OsmC-like protein